MKVTFMYYNKWAEDEILPLYKILKQKGIEFCYLNALPNYPEFKYSVAHISFVNQYDVTDFIKYSRNQDVPNILVVFPDTAFSSEEDTNYLPKDNIFYVEKFSSLEECAQAIVNKIEEFVKHEDSKDNKDSSSIDDLLSDIIW